MSNFFLNISIKEYEILYWDWNKESLSFLDFEVFRENDKFFSSVFRKDTFGRVYTNSISFIPLDYNFGLVQPLLNRCFSLSFDFSKFHHELDKLKNKTLSRNAYPQKCITYLNSFPKAVSSITRFLILLTNLLEILPLFLFLTIISVAVYLKSFLKVTQPLITINYVKAATKTRENYVIIVKILQHFC